jgi:Beta-lactamase
MKRRSPPALCCESSTTARLFQAVQRYTDGLHVAAEQLVGPETIAELDQADQYIPRLTTERAWRTTPAEATASHRGAVEKPPEHRPHRRRYRVGSLDATLPELLPDHAATMTVDQRSVTLRQLLTMSGRFSDGHGDRSPSDGKVASILKLPLQATPGTQHIHSDPGAQLVSAIVAEATGMTTLDYARKKLFGPLGISSTPAYTEVAAWGRDMGHPRWRPSTTPNLHGRSPRTASATGAAC